MSVTTRIIRATLLTLLPMAGVGRPVCAGQVRTDSPQGTNPPEVQTSGLADSPLEQRLQQETWSRSSQFSILPHKTNHLIPATYNTCPNNDVYASMTNNNEEIDNLEVKFQLSIKNMLWDNISGINGTLYAAYSQFTFWQAYNSSILASTSQPSDLLY